MKQNRLNPHISVDCVVFGFDSKQLHVLLVRRDFVSTEQLQAVKKDLKLPGSLVYEDEDIDNAAARVLKELTGLENIYLSQLKIFGHPDRMKNQLDREWLSQTTNLPISRVVTVAYYSLVKIGQLFSQKKLKRQDAVWVPLKDLGELAFDHNTIVNYAAKTLRLKLQKEPVGFELLPSKFTIRQLQDLYEVIIGRELDSRNFRKKLARLPYLQPTGEKEKGVAHKPAMLYKFHRKEFKNYKSGHFDFTL